MIANIRWFWNLSHNYQDEFCDHFIIYYFDTNKGEIFFRYKFAFTLYVRLFEYFSFINAKHLHIYLLFIIICTSILTYFTRTILFISILFNFTFNEFYLSTSSVSKRVF